MKIHKGDGWAIHVGSMSAGSDRCDIVFTDPPFTSATHEGSRTNNINVPKSTSPIDFDPIEVRRDMVDRLIGCSRGWVLVKCELEMLGDYRRSAGGARSDGGQYVRGGLWIKHNPTPQISGDRPGSGAEAFAIMHPRGGKMTWNGRGKANVWTSGRARQQDRIHPTQMPVGLCVELLRLFAPSGASVLDPYCGSASIGVAALGLGMTYVGYEIDKDMASAAANRLRNCERGVTATTREQISMFAN